MRGHVREELVRKFVSWYEEALSSVLEDIIHMIESNGSLIWIPWDIIPDSAEQGYHELCEKISELLRKGEIEHEEAQRLYDAADDIYMSSVSALEDLLASVGLTLIASSLGENDMFAIVPRALVPSDDAKRVLALVYEGEIVCMEPSDEILRFLDLLLARMIDLFLSLDVMAQDMKSYVRRVLEEVCRRLRRAIPDVVKKYTNRIARILSSL